MKSCILKKMQKYTLLSWMILRTITIIPTQLTEILKYGFILFSIICIIKNNFKIRNSFLCKLIYIYLILLIVSCILSPYISIQLFASTLQFVLISFCVINISSIELYDYIVIFSRILKKVTLVAVVYSIILFLFGQTELIAGQRINYFLFPILGQKVIGVIGDRGYSSIFGNPNTFALMIVISLAWSISSFYKFEKTSFLEYAFLVLGLILANSRAGFICALLAILISFSVKFDIGRLKKYLILMIGVLGLLFIYMYREEISTVISSINLEGRDIKWTISIKSIRQHFLLGTGFSSGNKYLLYELGMDVFNSYLSILMDAGIVGLLIFIILYLSSLYKSIKNIYVEKSQFTIFSIVILIVLFINGFVESVFMNITQRSILFFMIIISLNDYEIYKREFDNDIVKLLKRMKIK